MIRFCSYRVFLTTNVTEAFSTAFKCLPTLKYKSIRVNEYAGVGRHAYHPHHQTVIINPAIWRSICAVWSLNIPSPNCHYQPSNLEKKLCCVISNHPITQLSLSTQQSGEVFVLCDLWISHHPTVIIKPAIWRSSCAVWSLTIPSPNCHYQASNLEK